MLEEYGIGSHALALDWGAQTDLEAAPDVFFNDFDPLESPSLADLRPVKSTSSSKVPYSMDDEEDGDTTAAGLGQEFIRAIVPDFDRYSHERRAGATEATELCRDVPHKLFAADDSTIRLAIRQLRRKELAVRGEVSAFECPSGFEMQCIQFCRRFC